MREVRQRLIGANSGVSNVRLSLINSYQRSSRVCRGRAACVSNPFLRALRAINMSPTRATMAPLQKESWLEEARPTYDWVMWCKSKKGAEEIRSFDVSGKEIFSNYNETKSKEGKNKKDRSKNNAHRGQSVRYRSLWKQGNIKISVSDALMIAGHAGFTKTSLSRQNKVGRC